MTRSNVYTAHGSRDSYVDRAAVCQSLLCLGVLARPDGHMHIDSYGQGVRR